MLGLRGYLVQVSLEWSSGSGSLRELRDNVQTEEFKIYCLIVKIKRHIDEILSKSSHRFLGTFSEYCSNLGHEHVIAIVTKFDIDTEIPDSK